jgi:long-subunit fatty acid transport protein
MWRPRLLALLLVLPPALARAAGIEHPDIGTVAIGRGGAVAAQPADGIAFQHNPAGFAFQRGLRVTVDGNLAWQGLSFAQAGGAPEVHDGSGPFLVPAAAVSYGLGPVGPLSGLTFALGGTGPNAIGRESYPREGAQRYALVDADYFIAYLSGAVAASWRDVVSLGLTLQLVHGNATFTQAVWSGPSMGTDPAFDALAKVDVTNGLRPTGVLGLTVRPTPRLSLGASYRPRWRFDGSGSLTTELPASAKAIGARQSGTDASFIVDFPDVVRAGALYRFGASERVLVEADVVWEGWSRLHTIEIHPHGITVVSDNFGIEKPLPNIVFRKDYQDSVSLRAGADVAILPGRLVGRAGYLFETTAIPDNAASVDFGNWQRHMLGVGASIYVGHGTTVDVAYAHHFLASPVATGSNVVQVVTPCLTPGCTDPAPTVTGNGRYSGSLDVASLALRFALDLGASRP